MYIMLNAVFGYALVGGIIVPGYDLERRRLSNINPRPLRMD